MAACLLCLLLLFFLFSASSSGCGYLWQGLDYQWEHKIAGFETPHRMGSMSSYFDSTVCSTMDSSVNVSSQGHIRFSPGVDGDYAFPTIYSSAYAYEGAAVSSAQFSVNSGVWTASFQDEAIMGEHPYASTSFTFNGTVPLPPGADSRIQVALLNGFNISMACVNTTTSLCNSNADWVYHFSLSILGCSTVPSLNELSCEISVTLDRGWTPDRGGGKAFNEKMSYELEVSYSVFDYSSSLACAQFDQIQNNATLFTRATFTNRTLADQCMDSFSEDSVVRLVGISGFGWHFVETDGYEDLGRYIERFAFAVQNPLSLDLPSESSSLMYSYIAGLMSPPLTTYPTNAIYSLNTTLLTLNVSYRSELSFSLKAVEVSGEVCEDDRTEDFHCAAHSPPLLPTLVDNVPVSTFLPL